MIILAPEIIEGAGQYRAGLGAIVTDWCASEAEAQAEYYRLAREADERQRRLAESGTRWNDTLRAPFPLRRRFGDRW
jgi:hypothetical protein